jgi:hypothetical protein
VGYALIDTYNGDIQILTFGDDFFTELFRTVYADYVTDEVPEWVTTQLRYPPELFEWRIEMYSFFHVTDVSTFIVAKEFFVVPEGLETHYIYAKPPGFAEPEYVGLLSLELRGGLGRNLAGYAIVRNDPPNFGELRFYRVALDSPTKLLGPTAVLEALDRNPEFAQLKTLLRSPRVGDILLYRVGEQDVYFIPVYTAGEGGVVAELGAVAAVGAAFTGEYFVGLGSGSSSEEAFRNYLATLGGVEVPPEPVVGRHERLERVESLFFNKDIRILKPTAIPLILTFLEGTAAYASESDWPAAQGLIDDFITSWLQGQNLTRVFSWEEGKAVHFGVIVTIEDVQELHYIAVELE